MACVPALGAMLFIGTVGGTALTNARLVICSTGGTLSDSEKPTMPPPSLEQELERARKAGLGEGWRDALQREAGIGYFPNKSDRSER